MNALTAPIDTTPATGADRLWRAAIMRMPLTADDSPAAIRAAYRDALDPIVDNVVLTAAHRVGATVDDPAAARDMFAACAAILATSGRHDLTWIGAHPVLVYTPHSGADPNAVWAHTLAALLPPAEDSVAVEIVETLCDDDTLEAVHDYALTHPERVRAVADDLLDPYWAELRIAGSGRRDELVGEAQAAVVNALAEHLGIDLDE